MVDVGLAATDRAVKYGPGLTLIDINNSADSAFTCSKVEVWFDADDNDADNVKVGSFFGGGGTWENRDFATLGAVTRGSKQTFTGLSIDFQSGDMIGMWSEDNAATGVIEADASGFAGIEFIAGDQFGAGEVSGYNTTSLADDGMSVFGDDTGAAAVNFSQAQIL